MAIPIHSARFSIPPAALTPANRVEGIAMLLAKAMVLADAKQVAAMPGESPWADEPGDSHDERILRFLRISGRGSPAVIRQGLGLSKTTAYRAFLRLTKSGAINVTGQARTVAYILAEREPPPDTIDRN
jgi:hypothetical protein